MATKDVDLSSLRIDRSSSGPQGRKSKWLRKLLGWSIVLLVVLAALYFARDLLNPPLEVQLVSASLTSPSQANAVLTASGYVVARRKAAVASKGTGRLVFLGVEEGDPVKKGQVIARLEDGDVVAAWQRAKENLRVAEADREDARKNFERMRQLLNQGIVAQVEFDVANARYKRVLATIEAAKFGVREADVAVGNTRIVAPFDGTVLKKNADVGEIVAPLAGAASSKAAVVTIADMSSLEVDADVSEANITKVSPDQGCEITLDAYPERRYPGFVTKIVPTADRAKATVMVKIKFKEYDERVLPEMSAKITFLALGSQTDPASRKALLTLPRAAVVERDGRKVVYQIEQDVAVERVVETGGELSGLVVIKSGLKEGEKVVSRIDPKLKPGMKVSLKGN